MCCTYQKKTETLCCIPLPPSRLTLVPSYPSGQHCLHVVPQDCQSRQRRAPHQVLPQLAICLLGQDVAVKPMVGGLSIHVTEENADAIEHEAPDVLRWMRRHTASIRAMHMCPPRLCTGGGIVAMRADLTPHTRGVRVVEIPGKGGTRTCAYVLHESILTCMVEWAQREASVCANDPEPYVVLVVALDAT